MSINYNEHGKHKLSHCLSPIRGAGELPSNASSNSSLRRRRPVIGRLGGRIEFTNISPNQSTRDRSRTRHRSNFSPYRTERSDSRHSHRSDVSPCRSACSSSRHRSNVSQNRSSRSGSRHRSNISPDTSTCDISWDSIVVSEQSSSDLEGSCSPWQERPNELNLERRKNVENPANVRQEISFVNISNNLGYSAKHFSYREDMSHGEVHGSRPAVSGDASWQFWQGNVAGDQLVDPAAVVPPPLLQWQCNMCSLDFTDREVKIVYVSSYFWNLIRV